MSSVLGVIPARYASTRLPGKPLAMILGKPMVQWVYESAKKSLKNVIVATDDDRIVKAVEAFGGEAMMTPPELNSGTERMAFVAKKKKADYYVNIQGDEPMMNPFTIRATVALSQKRKAVATPATSLEEKDFLNPNAVKVVLGDKDRAIYFSRSMIPYPRNLAAQKPPLKHIGLYVYPKKDLFAFVAMKPTALEQTESLEQLRALYYGMPIYIAKTKFDSVGVDTPADLKAVEARLK